MAVVASHPFVVRLRSLAGNAEGTAAVEFAIIGPILVTVMIGLLELSRIATVATLLELASHEASRYGITGAVPGQVTPTEAQRQARIRQIVADYTVGLVDMNKITIETKAYTSFDNIGKPEPPFDVNGNGKIDPGEYLDVNGNGVQDQDMGRSEAGGSNDVVVYTLRYEQPVVTGIMSALIGRPSIEHEARVVVRNEPFGGASQSQAGT